MPSVLVVDDEVAMREFYNRALTAGGFDCVAVATAEDALEYLARSSEVGVVVADLNMPGHGGAWLVQQMRGRFPGIAVILATADDQVSGAVSLLPTVSSYLVKPIEIPRLLAATSAAMSWHTEHGATARPASQNQTAIEDFLDRKLTHRKPEPDAE